MPGPTTVKYGGNTTCFEIRAGKHLIIVDAGTGIINLGYEMMADYHRTRTPIRTNLLFTHLHHDHTQGLPFFVPLRYPGANLYIFGAKPSDDSSLEHELIQAIQPPFFPLGLEEIYSNMHTHHIRGNDQIVIDNPLAEPIILEPHQSLPELSEESLRIQVHHGYHHPRAGILIFRIHYQGRSMVIATDTEGFIGGDRRLIAFCRGADLLVHDAEYDEEEYADQAVVRQGWGHSTWRMAIDVAQAAGVKKLALHHHNPNHDDAYMDAMELKAQAAFPETIVAREGLTISI